jgi:adenylate cyclase
MSLAGVAIAVSTFMLVQHLSLKPPRTSASIPPAEKPALPLPTIPSIAVLPFKNLSGDPGQEYFSDGISDYLITNLSRVPDLFVVARSSSFAYKKRSVAAQQIGRELGVRLVLEGSVLRATNRIQINVQLADAASGTNRWAQGFDRTADDLFSVQNEILRKIVTTVALLFKLDNLKVPRGWAGVQPIENLEAFDEWLRGEESHWRFTREDNVNARRFFEKALALDPKYSDAYAELGWTYPLAVLFQWSENPAADIKQASELAQKALALDDSNSRALALISEVDQLQGRPDQGIADGQRAVELNPNYASGYWVVSEVGREQDARSQASDIMRLNPQYKLPARGGFFPKTPILAQRYLADLRRAGLK